MCFSEPFFSLALASEVEDVQVPPDLALLVNSDRMLLSPLGVVVRLPLTFACKVRRLSHLQKVAGGGRSSSQRLLPQLQEDGVHVDGSAVRKDGVV